MPDKRPLSVIAAAWMMLIPGAIKILALIVVSLLDNTVPAARSLLEKGGPLTVLALFWLLGQGIVEMASGMMVQQGKNFGRVLYLWYAPTLFVLMLLMSGRWSALSVVYYIAIAVLLNRPAALNYFI